MKHTLLHSTISVALLTLATVAPSHSQNDSLDVPSQESKPASETKAETGSIFLLPENTKATKKSFLFDADLARSVNVRETTKSTGRETGASLDDRINFSGNSRLGFYGLFKMPEPDPSELEDKPLVLKPEALPENQSLIDSLLSTNLGVGSRWGLSDRTSVNVEWEKDQTTDDEKLSAGFRVDLD